MKNPNALLCATLIAGLIFTSCSNDDDNTPVNPLADLVLLGYEDDSDSYSTVDNGMQQPLNLTGDDFPTSLSFYNNDTYMSLSRRVNGVRSYGILKNGVLQPDFAANGKTNFTEDIKVNAAGVHVVGREIDGNTIKATYYLNGVRTYLPGNGTNNSFASALDVTDSRVAICGRMSRFFGNDGATWLNGLYSAVQSNAVLTVLESVTNDGQDNYYGGYEDVGQGQQPAIWKNQTRLYALGAGSVAGSVKAITVFNGDVYSLVELGTSINGNSVRQVQLWRNEDFVKTIVTSDLRVVPVFVGAKNGKLYVIASARDTNGTTTNYIEIDGVEQDLTGISLNRFQVFKAALK